MSPAPHEVFLALGGNLGRPVSAISQAIDALAGCAERIAVAPLYRSPAAAGRAQPDYLNTAARLYTHLLPEDLLAVTKLLEWLAGRRHGARNAARPLDIDLLLYDERRIERPELTVPHPRMRDRAFVLAPLADLAPRRRLPPDGRTAGELLRRLPDAASTRRVRPPGGSRSAASRP